MSETVRLPVMPSLNIEEFVGSSIVTASSLSTNVVYDNYPEKILYATQRPSVNVIEDASAQGVGARGRGIYYWDAQDKLYIVNDDTIHINTYGGTQLTITAGTQKVYFAELGLYLVCIDPENGEGWVIDSANDVILQMTGSGTWAASGAGLTYDFSGFHEDLTNILTNGLVVLDGTMYSLSESGEIVGSEIEDPLNWSITNVIVAEKEPDTSVYIGKHHDNIFVLGTKTLEYFYDAANTTGSPLSPREDVSYNTGCGDGKSVWTEGDVSFFIGATNSGELGAYMMTGFQIKKVSTPPTDSYFTASKVLDSSDLLGSGFTSGGRTYYIITLYSTDTNIIPEDTLVYNVRSGTWSLWEHSYDDIDEFPLVGWTISVSTSAGIAGKGIFYNGDYISILDDFNPQDATNAQVYVEGILSISGTDVVFTNATSSINSVLSDLSGFSDGDEILVSDTANNNGSFIINGTPTTNQIITTIAPTDEASGTATVLRDDYWEDGYVSDTGAGGTFIPMTIRFGHIDFGTRNSKRMHELRYVGDATAIEQTLNVSWADDRHDSFSTPRGIDISNSDDFLTRLGRFKSRTFELTLTGSEQVRIEGIEVDISKDNN